MWCCISKDLTDAVLSSGTKAADLFQSCYTEDVRHTHAFLKGVCLLDWPLNLCTKNEYREQSKYSTRLYTKKVRETLYKLTKIVEKKIGRAMVASGKGVVMSDAWTKFGYHYICILAVFMASGGGSNGKRT